MKPTNFVTVDVEALGEYAEHVLTTFQSARPEEGMTVTANGGVRFVTEVELIEQALRDAGVVILPRREWIQWHVHHKTPLNAILYAAGVRLSQAS